MQDTAVADHSAVQQHRVRPYVTVGTDPYPASDEHTGADLAARTHADAGFEDRERPDTRVCSDLDVIGDHRTDMHPAEALIVTKQFHRPHESDLGVLHPQQVAARNRRKVFTHDHTGSVAAPDLIHQPGRFGVAQLPGPGRIQRRHTAYRTFRQALEAGPDLARNLTKGVGNHFNTSI